jgi:hypothetical protein
VSASAKSRLRWAPAQVFPDGAYRGLMLADVAAIDPWYLRARARWPRPDWPHSLVVALRLVAVELGTQERAA